MSDIRKALAAIASKAPRKVEIEGLEVPVFIKSVTLADYEFSESGENDTPEQKSERLKANTAKALARLICDAKGVRVFDPDNPDDITFLQSLPLETISAMNKGLTDAPN